MVWQDQLGTVMSAIVILTQFTMLWKDNVFFRWGTRVVVGYAMVDWMAWAWYYLNIRMWVPFTTKGEWWWWFGIILGLMLYLRLSRQYAWVAKYPLAVQLGLGIGVTAATLLRAQILDQIQFTINSLFTAKTTMDLFNAIVVFIGVATVLSYFFFTREHTGVLARTAYVGRAYIMASVAVIWAGDYMWAMAILAGVLSFLVNNFVKNLLLGMPI